MANQNFTIMDPRPVAVTAPYTFFLPHEVDLAALRVGDMVKITFEWEEPVVEYSAERMWVTIMQLDGEILMGVLETNHPRKIACTPAHPLLSSVMTFLRSAGQIHSLLFYCQTCANTGSAVL